MTAVTHVSTLFAPTSPYIRLTKDTIIISNQQFFTFEKYQNATICVTHLSNDALYLAIMLYNVQALWLPGSQTEVAIVTADFVKIYNLSVDAISPQFYFLLPTGKIRDATFVVSDSERHLVLMASSGYIYTQVMDVSSSAQHGPFYITNILEMNHTDVKVSRVLDSLSTTATTTANTFFFIFFSSYVC